MLPCCTLSHGTEYTSSGSIVVVLGQVAAWGTSLPRDRTHAACVGNAVLTTGLPAPASSLSRWNQGFLAWPGSISLVSFTSLQKSLRHQETSFLPSLPPSFPPLTENCFSHPLPVPASQIPPTLPHSRQEYSPRDVLQAATVPIQVF